MKRESMQTGSIGEDSGYSPDLLMFLLKTPRKVDAESPVEWISDSQV